MYKWDINNGLILEENEVLNSQGVLNSQRKKPLLNSQGKKLQSLQGY